MTEASLSSFGTNGFRSPSAGGLSRDNATCLTRSLIGNHAYSCALPVRGGVCDCQTGYNPSTNPWP